MVVFGREWKIDYQDAFLECMDPPTDNQEELEGLFERIKEGKPAKSQRKCKWNRDYIF